MAFRNFGIHLPLLSRKRSDCWHAEVGLPWGLPDRSAEALRGEKRMDSNLGPGVTSQRVVLCSLLVVDLTVWRFASAHVGRFSVSTTGLNSMMEWTQSASVFEFHPSLHIQCRLMGFRSRFPFNLSLELQHG